MILSTPSFPCSNPPISHQPILLQHHVIFLFCSILFLTTQQVQFLSLMCAWVWGHPLKHGKPTSDHTLKNNESF